MDEHQKFRRKAVQSQIFSGRLRLARAAMTQGTHHPSDLPHCKRRCDQTCQWEGKSYEINWGAQETKRCFYLQHILTYFSVILEAVWSQGPEHVRGSLAVQVLSAWHKEACVRCCCIPGSGRSTPKLGTQKKKPLAMDPNYWPKNWPKLLTPWDFEGCPTFETHHVSWQQRRGRRWK